MTSLLAMTSLLLSTLIIFRTSPQNGVYVTDPYCVYHLVDTFDSYLSLDTNVERIWSFWNLPSWGWFVRHIHKNSGCSLESLEWPHFFSSFFVAPGPWPKCNNSLGFFKFAWGLRNRRKGENQQTYQLVSVYCPWITPGACVALWPLWVCFGLKHRPLYIIDYTSSTGIFLRAKNCRNLIFTLLGCLFTKPLRRGKRRKSGKFFT